MLKQETRFWNTTWFRVTLGTLVSVFFLYLALRDVPLDAVAQALARADYAWVLVAIGAMVLQAWLRTIRWIRLFYPLHEGLRIRQMFGIAVLAQMLNIVAPWRLGDLARIYLAGEIEKRSKAQTLATLGTDKIFDTLILLIMILAIPLYVSLPVELEAPREGFIGLSILLFGAALALMFFGNWVLARLRQIPFPWFQQMLDTHGALALGSLDVFKRWDLHLELQALSIAISVLGVVANYLALLALGLQLPLIASVLLFPVLQIGGVVPSSPGKIGVFQYLCILTLSLFAVGQSIGLAYGILLYLIAYGTPIVLGILVMWWGGINLRGVTAEAR